MTGSPLVMLLFLFFFLFLVQFQQSIHISLCRQQLPHFLTEAPVLCIDLFLFLQEPGIRMRPIASDRVKGSLSG